MLKIELNEKCWCESGKKYKQCHMRTDDEKLKPYRDYPLPSRDLILNKEQIAGVRKSAIVTKQILDEAEKIIKEGVSTEEIDALIHKLTLEAGGTPAPLNYKGFPKSVCTSINNVICHGIPSKNDILKNGDILNVDITTILDGYYADMSRMYMIGEVSDNAKKLVEVTKKCLEEGIKAIKPYEPVSNIGNRINEIADEYGYSVVRALTGHGVGLKFHTEPNVEHFRTNEKRMILVPNMILTVEPMINEGTFNCHVLDDKWTVVTDDGKLSAQWEHTILVTEYGCEILTI